MATKIVMALAHGLTTLGLPPARLSLTCLWCHPVPWGRSCTSTVRARPRDCHFDIDVSPGSASDWKIPRREFYLSLWREFFSDPSQWWDHRAEKGHPRFPDFKHKRTGQALWLNNSFTPAWVEPELARMAPALLQSHNFSWNVRLRKYVEAEDYQMTLDLFHQMQLESLMIDKFTFVPVLRACSNLKLLEEGRRVHDIIIEKGCESESYVANCLIDMYAKCGSIDDAWSVFNKMQERDVVSWSAMIVGCVKSEQGLKALELFRQMQKVGVEPDAGTFGGVLNACASVAAVEEGRRVHEQIIQTGCHSDIYVATSLVDMYSKCGLIDDAWNVFNKMGERNVVSWSAIIVGYVKAEQALKALELFRHMQQEGVEPDAVTFVGALIACASVSALEEGRRVHGQIIQRGFECNRYVANSLVDMYAKCGRIGDAWSMFNKIREPDVVSWSAMIVGYVKSEEGLKALELFRKMQQIGVKPNVVTFVGVLNACAGVAALEEGRRVHQQIINSGCESDVYVANCLVDMYSKCGSIDDARIVFNKMQERDVISWSAMIGGYAMHGHSRKAIGLFKRMGKEGVKSNQITYISLLSACSHGGLMKEGLRYFNTMSSHHVILPTRTHYACMVDLLGRAGWLEEAEEMAKIMPMERNDSVWLSLLGACRIHGNAEMAERAAKRFWELDPEKASGHVLSRDILGGGIGLPPQ